MSEDVSLAGASAGAPTARLLLLGKPFISLWTVWLVVLGANFLLRLSLMMLSWQEAELTAAAAVQIFSVGAFYDIAFLSYSSLPMFLWLSLAPRRWLSSAWQKCLGYVFFIALFFVAGFGIAAELLFWEEFGVRFNFIAVDYLVYRQEVTNNILESYPVPVLLTVVLGMSAALVWILRESLVNSLVTDRPVKQRIMVGLALALLPVLSYVVVDQDQRELSENRYQVELAGNGPYQFFAAFRNNDMNFRQLYSTISEQQASDLLKAFVQGPFDSPFSGQPFDIRRHVDNPGVPSRLNVMLITIESLSADFLGQFGNHENLTPNLDALASESIFFTNFYATGTRTTRGLEAVTLSYPPTPGRSIVKRPGKERNLWSLGNVLQNQGYDVRFHYGGRGYFDNMSEFFSGNGYQVVDQSSVDNDELSFTNAWGMSDEDLYSQVLASARQANIAETPFFFHVMTTSNHRPYTYPEGRVDIPSGTSRAGAVKYTDWAIGDFLARARQQPWFESTVFVILADHCASSAGKEDLPINRYQIPMWIYSPVNLEPRVINTLASQIDVAPTVLGLLHADYESMAFGRDLLQDDLGEGRALIANYQELGLYSHDRVAILKPVRKTLIQEHAAGNQPRAREAEPQMQEMARTIAIYQGADYVFRNRLNRWERPEPGSPEVLTYNLEQ